jgi:hypothetical protein
MYPLPFSPPGPSSAATSAVPGRRSGSLGTVGFAARRSSSVGSATLMLRFHALVLGMGHRGAHERFHREDHRGQLRLDPPGLAGIHEREILVGSPTEGGVVQPHPVDKIEHLVPVRPRRNGDT